MNQNAPQKSSDTASADAITTVRGTGIVASLTMMSRALGFVRDLLVAKLFGATPIADAFFVAFRIPNLLRSFVAEGAMSSAFVPVFSSELKKGPQEAQQAFSSAVSLLFVITVPLTILGIIFAPQLVDLIAPGFRAKNHEADLCINLTRLMMPYILFVSLVALMNGALSAKKVFGASAWAQVLMNIALIIGAGAAFLVEENHAVYLLSLSVLVGGLVQVLAQFPALHRAGLSCLQLTSPLKRTSAEIIRLLAPALLGATAYQLSIFINTMLASLLEPGSISWLFYADRVTQFPIGVFTVALSSVLLPMLSAAAADGDRARTALNLNNALRFTHFLLIPIAALLCILAPQIVTLLFERGRFTSLDSTQTATIVVALAPGLWCTSCYSMLVRAFIAHRDTKTSVRIGLGSLIVSVLTAILLMGPIDSRSIANAPEWLIKIQQLLTPLSIGVPLGATGLAWGSSAGSLFSLLAALLVIKNRVPDFSHSEFFRQTGCAVLAALGAGALSLSVYSLALPASSPHPLLSLLAIGTLFCVLYLGLARLCGIREVEETFSLSRRLLQRLL